MQKCNKFFGLAASCLTLVGALAAGNAAADTVEVRATLKTKEFLLPAATATCSLGGIGVRADTTNLL